MPRSLVSSLVVASLGAIASTDDVLAQALVRVGSEFQVNVHTAAYQIRPAVGMDGDGDFVVVWTSGYQDGSGDGIFARRFNSAGEDLGAEFQVNVHTSDHQSEPAVGMDGDGDFVVAWMSYYQDGANTGAFARRFNSAGGALGAEFQVNVYTSNYQSFPTVGMEGDGDFVVAWESEGQDGASAGVFARRFDSAGGDLGAEFQVNLVTSSSQAAPAVDMDADGDFVVVWQSDGLDGSQNNVSARRFDSAGEALGGELQVNVHTSNNQVNPAVAMDADGDFVVAWQGDGQDGDGFGVFARRFDAGGGSLGGEFQVNSYTSSSQFGPAVEMDGDGDVVVAWHGEGQDGDGFGVFARRFDAGGGSLGGEFQVNSYTSSSQSGPAVEMDGDGNVVVAWSGFNQDGAGSGVFAQRFATPAVLDIDGNGSTGALTDGLLVLRFLFGFTGATLVTGAIDADGCTRCNAPTIEAYLQTLI